MIALKRWSVTKQLYIQELTTKIIYQGYRHPIQLYFGRVAEWSLKINSSSILLFLSDIPKMIVLRDDLQTLNNE